MRLAFLRPRPPGAWLRDQTGATALEFAMVATPFILLIFAILELGLIFLVTTSLDSATQESARQVRTCELAQAGGATAASFRDSVCANMGWLQNECSANLAIDVRGFSSFSNETAPNPVSNGKFDQSQLAFSTGSPGQVMLVRSFYQWKLLTPVFYGSLQSLPGGVDVITSTTTFRNEPCSTPS